MGAPLSLWATWPEGFSTRNAHAVRRFLGSEEPENQADEKGGWDSEHQGQSAKIELLAERWQCAADWRRRRRGIWGHDSAGLEGFLEFGRIGQIHPETMSL